MTGAPGSRWSSVAKNIYFSSEIDSSDSSPTREYYHAATGTYQPMHLGVYWGPGMEYGTWFDYLDKFSKSINQDEFDRPFSGQGKRIVKSHVFSFHIDYLKKTWPEASLILVYRNNQRCLDWWTKCGGFNISYPLYKEHYKDIPTMESSIAKENNLILEAIKKYEGYIPKNNLELCDILDVGNPPDQYFQEYEKDDIFVKVI